MHYIRSKNNQFNISTNFDGEAIRQHCVGRPGVTYFEVSADYYGGFPLKTSQLKNRFYQNLKKFHNIEYTLFYFGINMKKLADPKNIVLAVEQLKKAKRWQSKELAIDSRK